MAASEVKEEVEEKKKKTLAQVFSCEFCEISKNTFFYRTPLVAASVVSIHYKGSSSFTKTTETANRFSLLFSLNRSFSDLHKRSILEEVLHPNNCSHYFALPQKKQAFTCSKSTVETEKCVSRFGAFIVNLKHIPHFFLVFLLLTLNR